MSRSYRRHSSYNKSGTSNDAAFPIILLLTCAVWAHKTVMLKAEHYAMTVIYVVIGTIGLVLLYNFLKTIKSVRIWGQNSPNIDTIDNMTGLEFEHYVARLLKSQGYSNIQLTEKYDYGVDVIAVKNGTTWGIQVKRYSGLVKADAVRQVVTALKMYHCDQAMVITNSTFSLPAQALADSNDCILVDRTKLSNWARSD